MKRFIAIAASLALCSGMAMAQENRQQKEAPVQDKATQENMGKDRLQKDNMQVDNRTSTVKTNPDISSWPKTSQMAAKDMMNKYGQPDVVTADELVWKDKGNWKKICVSKMETRHDFPMSHTDMLNQTVSFRVPTDKMDELGAFDGSITFDRTQGHLSARCDKEENNILALNLAHDIIKGKKSVADARSELNKILTEKKNGGNPEYMQKLMFSPDAGAADPDKTITERMGMLE